MRLRLIGGLVVAILTPAGPAAAQTAPGPQAFFNGTVDLAYPFEDGGAPKINRLIRGDSPFDNVRLRLFADVVLNSRWSAFSQILIDPSSRLGLESFLRSYVRFNAFKKEKADLSFQAGVVPTPFGAYSPRAYSERNPLVSDPLMYHYFTSLRSNQLPASNADLLRHRGQGQSDDFTSFAGPGSPVRFNGMPMIYDPCWDVGVQALGSAGRLEYVLAVAQGTLSNPRFKGGDNNAGKQLSGRLAFVPRPGVVLGASYARGPYLDAVLQSGLRPGTDVDDFRQEIWGFDAEYGVRHLVLYAELARNRWQSPNITDGRGRRQDLTVLGGYVEAKYTLRPGLFAALRYDRIDFGDIDGAGPGARTPWDYDVRTWEYGVGYYLTDRVIAKLVRQDYRTAGEEGSEHFWAMQVSVSF
ncbi:MAG: hypothetical protein DMF80_07495 [Acidobacteria bacterium]|nr:MAG: hypothetical protein DMF80_07495 [Acidobacteriota bacterium]